MSENNTFKLLFTVLFVLVLIVRAYFGIKQRQIGQSSWSVNEDAVSREGRWSLLSRPVGFLLMLGLIVLYYVEPSGLEWLFLPIPSWLRVSGVLLATAGILLLVWVHRTLGMQWSTTLQFREGHTLNTSGPYKFVRHPMYASLFLFFLGLSIMSSYWPLMALVVIFLLFFNRIMGREESMMIDQFGEKYRVYMKSTGRFLPRLR